MEGEKERARDTCRQYDARTACSLCCGKKLELLTVEDRPKVLKFRRFLTQENLSRRDRRGLKNLANCIGVSETRVRKINVIFDQSRSLFRSRLSSKWIVCARRIITERLFTAVNNPAVRARINGGSDVVVDRCYCCCCSPSSLVIRSQSCDERADPRKYSSTHVRLRVSRARSILFFPPHLFLFIRPSVRRRSPLPPSLSLSAISRLSIWQKIDRPGTYRREDKPKFRDARSGKRFSSL